MANNKAGASTKAQYTAYKVRGAWRKNKEAKLTRRALVENNTHALDVFLKGSKVIGRSKPGTKGWFPPQEAKLLRECSSEVVSIASAAKEKLFKLREIYADKRPSAIRMKPIRPILAPTVAEQFLTIGLINAKRYKTFESRKHSVRRR